MSLKSIEEQMFDATAIHEAAHSIIDTVLGLSVHCTFINPHNRNGRTEYTPELSEEIEVLLRAPSLDPVMKSLAERVGTALAAGYVAEARHRGVPHEAICSTEGSPGLSDCEKMKNFCAKIQA